MSLPRGVRILAGLRYLLGVFYAGLLASVLVSARRTEYVFALGFAGVSTILLSLGTGLWRGRRWGWILGQLVFLLVVMVPPPLALAGVIPPEALPTVIVIAIVAIALLRYLRSPAVKSAFNTASVDTSERMVTRD